MKIKAINSESAAAGWSGQSELSMPDKIYGEVINSILKGEFAKEGKLPTETDLAERFGVSRPTVREALTRLRSNGIITSRRGSGSYVVRMPEMNVRQLTSIESIQDVERYYAFRMCVESGAAGLAAVMHTGQDMDLLNAAYADLANAVATNAPGVDEDIRFHLAVAAASHNKFFISTVEFIVGPIRQCMELARNVLQKNNGNWASQIENEHRAIVDAIAQRSSDEASNAMHQHLVNARRRIFEGA